MAANRKPCLKVCSKIPTPRLWMYAALPMAALRSEFNAHKDSLPNSLLEFRRCINDPECLGFLHENARTSAARRDDVSRPDEPRSKFRRNLLHRRAHDWNFLPAHMLGKKTGTRKRRFFCNIKRRFGERLSPLFALPPTRSKCASAEI